MKFLTSEILGIRRKPSKRRNIKVLVQFLFFLGGLITVWSILFHYLMKLEGQDHTWITGFYWTLTVMSTLGFGDITFHTDIGRVFSICVLLSGTLFMLILLPFTFIEFFYEPWVEARDAARAPTSLPEDEHGHVVLIHYDTVTSSLIKRLEQYNYKYCLLVTDLEEALTFYDLGIRVVIGDPGSPETYQHLRIQNAALVASLSSDVVNTNVAFTVRGLQKTIPIITRARDLDSVDILHLAGATHVLELGNMTGRAMARRTSSNAQAHLVGSFDDLYIAEATAARTPLVGKTLKESSIRESTNCSVIGIWNRGNFQPATSDTLISENSVLVLAGSKEQLQEYDMLFCIYHTVDTPVVIIGGGRVGRAVGKTLSARNIDYRIVEMKPERILNHEKYVQGNANDRTVLEAAGIQNTPSVVITTHDDDMNVYLSIYCRSLRPDVQIVSRAVQEHTAAVLTRAGVDFVVSDATMGANMIFNLLHRSDVIMVAEGLHVFRMKMPEALANSTIANSAIREKTGCSVVAVRTDSETAINPGPDYIFDAGAEISLIGTIAAEEKFVSIFTDKVSRNP
ncbi:MAG: potassium channel protein [SAR324 cluster bacterium]|nr:potassium channel protein [SAR324 cluster bacterium]